jgi:hypothetical protein
MVDDIIIAVGGREIRDLTDLSRLLRQRDAGQIVNVILFRGQVGYAGSVVLGSQPTPVATTAPTPAATTAATPVPTKPTGGK